MSEELAVYSAQITDIAQNTKNVLQANQTSVEKALEYGNTLIATIQQTGMNLEMDQKCNEYLVKLRKTLEKLQEQRKPITQVFDQIKKEFTALESQIDQKSQVYTSVQKLRDQLARQIAEENERKEREIRERLEKERELNEIKAKIESEINAHFNYVLKNMRDTLFEKFNSTTIENIDRTRAYLSNFQSDFPKQFLMGFKGVIISARFKDEEINEIKKEIIESLHPEFSRKYKETIEIDKSDWIEKLPGKERELQAIANSSRAEALRLKKEAEERSLLEKQRLEEEKRQADEKSRLESEAKKNEANMASLFDASLQPTDEQSAQVRQSMKIIVTHQAAYVQIFQLWFEREGKSLSLDKLEKKTLKQMTTFCESLAKNGEKISSPYIKYETEIKTVAKS